MRRKARADDNQQHFVKLVRRAGVGYIVTSSLSGKYTFDGLAIFRGETFVVELKDPDKFPKYFFDLDRDKKREYMEEKALSDNEKDTLDLLEAHGSKLIITYSADHFLREIGALAKPFQT